MFIGHFAPALAAKAVTRDAPRLGTLFIAAQLIDWAFFLFAMIGIENLRIVPGITAMNPLDLYHMPISHSLLGTAGFAIAFALVVYLVSRNAVAATWAGIVVISHWVLDLLVHRPDLTLAGGEEKLGLGLWNQPLIAMPLELGLIGLAFWWYMRRTKGPIVPPLILLAIMLVMQAINWFGPEPKAADLAMKATALFAFAVVTAIAYWVDLTRWHKSEVGLAVSSAPR
ncbi:hypothetical protein P8Q88_14910 [Qipengyuania sp. XHP0207]|uniref:hypothetical protein n=1 Tax=Qipengyuania sp. XHP0207 TaxID=3038078 RepID=UPI00241F15C3|nr:hypothetical protein [Qipengyuania sp. XHP0207]MDG5749467.1 hypothetical protein [Qipengyuania sp. XHP0207]